MYKSGARSSLVLASAAIVVVACIALATPAADSFRHAIAPRLPLYVILLAIISGVAQLVSALVDLISRSFERRVIALRLTLAASALFLALAFSAFATERRPLLLPFATSAILAVVAAGIARRSRLHPHP